jgi:hypothetical protein
MHSWMPADSLWSFCMALNIYLTFYRRYTEEDIKKLEKWYFLLCYGLPLVLATVLISIKTDERGRIYGPALVGVPGYSRMQQRSNSQTDLVLDQRAMAIPSSGVFLWSSMVCLCIIQPYYLRFSSSLKGCQHRNICDICQSG